MTRAMSKAASKTRRRLAIDADLLVASQEYVNKQMDVMAQYGERPKLTERELDKLIYDCAAYPQRLRNQVRRVPGVKP
jgi:hypothetical protein